MHQTLNCLVFVFFSGSKKSAGQSGQAEGLIGRTNKEIFPLSVSSLQMVTSEYPSDYGLPTNSPLPRSYNSLQPNLFPTRISSNTLLPADQQYPTLPSSFRSPYIHTADSGPSAIVYYPKGEFSNLKKEQENGPNMNQK